MKGFTRKETSFSLCGLNCRLCIMNLGGYCPGCGGGAGNQSCAIAKCSIAHGGIQFCWECAEYPCLRYENFDEWDSFISHHCRKRDIARVQTLGLVAYQLDLEEKRTILEELLIHYNDGRSKTFFATAVCLLPLEDLRSVMESLCSQVDTSEQFSKERTQMAMESLQTMAEKHHICLKLKKVRKQGSGR